MNKEQLAILLKRYLENQCSGEEKRKLLAHFKMGDHEEFLKSWILDHLNSPLEEGFEIDADVIESFIKTDQFLAEALKPEWRLHLNRQWIKIAAFFVLSTTLAITLYFYWPKQLENVQSVSQINSITALSNETILTLADGTKIALNEKVNGRLAQQSNVQVTKTASGQIVYRATPSPEQQATKSDEAAMNTISTPSQQQCQIVLPDGSKVWLNAKSSLRFPVAFNGEKREVTLVGEGYFEIAQRARNPFIVVSKNQVVSVLGTHFNINSYTDESSVKTTLLEGVVAVSIIGSSGSHLIKKRLHPGQQSIIANHGNQIAVEAVKLEEVMAWKNGLFIFNDAYLVDIIRQFTRWYGVEADFNAIPHIRYNGAIPRSFNLSKALAMLGKTANIQFETKNGKILIKNL